MGSKRVFITGGASGLGRALANRFADAGYWICIGDVDDGRGAEVLAELKAKGKAHYINCDVTKEYALQSAADWLLSNWGGVDVVINNAGVATAGGIAEFSMEDWEWVVNINLLGVVRGSKVFARLMRDQGSGHIVNIASMAGLIYPPKMGSYCATKAAVVALSETMSLELDADNIKVSVVCPSFFRTNLAESVRASDADSQAATQRLVNKAKLDANEIAGRVFSEIEKGEFYILPHPEGRSIWRLKRWLPYKRYRAMMLKQTAGMMKNRAKG